MQQAFHRWLRHAERARKILVADVRTFRRQITMQNFVDPPPAFAFAFHPQPPQRLFRDGRRPARIEERLRAERTPWPRADRDNCAGASAIHFSHETNWTPPPRLCRRRLTAASIRKFFSDLSNKRTETPALGIGRLEKVSFQDHEEKILRQVLRVRRGIAPAINEGENGPPINLAELRQPGIDLAPGARSIAVPDQTPARRHEMCQRARAFSNAIQLSRIQRDWLDFSLKHKMARRRRVCKTARPNLEAGTS